MIMIITDHSPLRAELTEFLDQQGYEVLVPPHRHDIYALAQVTTPQVVVVDLYVANPNALEIVENIRKQGFTGKILIIAGASVRNAVPEALRLGADQAIGGPRGNKEPFMGKQVEAAIHSFFQEEIQRLAFQIYETRGCSHGRDWDDWFEAERVVLKRRNRTSSFNTPLVQPSNIHS